MESVQTDYCAKTIGIGKSLPQRRIMPEYKFLMVLGSGIENIRVNPFSG